VLRHATQAILSVAICCLLVSLSAAQEDDALIGRNRYEMTKLESELNNTYVQSVQTAKLSRTAEAVEIIKDSESKWRAYRDAECKAEHPLSTGDQGACLITLTRQRIAALKAAYIKAPYLIN